MQLRLDKPWIELSDTNIASLPGQLGVYQVADENGTIVKIGFAGGKSLFGMRSAIESERRLLGSRAAKFRYEVNMQYTSRYRELLMLHIGSHGEAPEFNRDSLPRRLGRLG